MYIPKHFKLDDQQQILDFVARNNFGLLVSRCQHEPSGVQVAHMPFLLDQDRHCLYGHLAKANPQCQTLAEYTQVLAVFPGPHAYISPRWYEDQNQVPTWNFSAVHITGKVTIVDMASSLQVVSDLSDFHETGRSNPWSVAELEEKKLQALLKAIVSFRVDIQSIEAKAKMSQNKSLKDRHTVMAGLITSDTGQSLSADTAAMMAAYEEQLKS